MRGAQTSAFAVDPHVALAVDVGHATDHPDCDQRKFGETKLGAGPIICNYDGANKHRTVIEDNVHIGSDVQLVAPITIGRGADIAAGTTVWKDIPPGEGLTLNAKTQIRKSDWKRPLKKPKP